jgi:hypothetical protein
VRPATPGASPSPSTTSARCRANQGDVAEAARSFEESERIFRESGQKNKAVYPMIGLAGIRFEAGRSRIREEDV